MTCNMDQASNIPSVLLANAILRIGLDASNGCLRDVQNTLTDTPYAIVGDGFSVEFDSHALRHTDMAAELPHCTDTGVRFRFSHPLMAAEIRYELLPGRHFAEKHLALVFFHDVALRRVTLGTPTFPAADVSLVCYRYPDFDWLSDYVRMKHGWSLRRPVDSEPNRTFFVRSANGGLFTGIEMPYDRSTLRGPTVRLEYTPNLKVRAGERFEGEAMYLGVYRRGPRDLHAETWKPTKSFMECVAGSTGFDGAAAAGLAAKPQTEEMATLPASSILPLPSESAAMTAMASDILGPPRHGLTAFACGWHSEMQQAGYHSDEELERDLQSLEFIRACGVDGLTDSHPWGGETAKMRELREDGRYVPGPRVLRFANRARELGLKLTQWPTMNNTHPWRDYGGPFCSHRSDWLRRVEGEPLSGTNADHFERRKANCVACLPFARWLERIIVDDALGTDLYESWCMDGDFWGTGAFFHTTVPVTCLAANHDHLPGDANYACQRMLSRLIVEVRRRHPGIYIIMCRPFQDLGIWAQRNVDACFTLIESGTAGSNVAGGDEIRTASRIRVHHQFFPHWLDQSLLFPSFGNPARKPAWPSAKLDYILLSALSCSPNLLMYLPTKTGIPDKDKAEIAEWLDWGRRNVDFLFVRRDLLDWPGRGRVDGSAHFQGEEGIIFLFNPDNVPQEAEFVLSREETGFTGRQPVTLRQEYPVMDRSQIVTPGAKVRWTVPEEGAVVLRTGNNRK